MPKILGVPLALVALYCPHGALAQSGSNPIDERVGPNATQRLPDFPQPPDFPRATPGDLPIPMVSDSVTLSDVVIDDGGAPLARAMAPYAAASGGESSLSVSLRAGETLDAPWVRRQFADNGLIASGVRLDRIVALVQLINRAFVANGYINSGVLITGAPPENGGPLHLRLVSGRITDADKGGIAVQWGPSGRNRLSEDYILNRMPAARAVPLNAAEVEREFRQLAENPTIETINADLRPGNRPGEAQLTLTVDPQPLFDVYLSAANNRSPSIGGERYAIGASFRNALRPGDFLSGEVGNTAGRYDFIAGYETPFVDPKTSLSIRASRNKSAVIDPRLLALNIRAADWGIEGGIARIVAQRPLTPLGEGQGWRSARTIKLGIGIAHRRTTTELLGMRFSFSPGAVDGVTEYTVLRVSADMVQRGIDTVFVASLTGTQGLEGTRSDIPGLVTPDTGFRAVRGQLSYARRLNASGLELRARLGGQWADGLIYSGERFSAGGAESVRGYRETLVLADTGLNGSLELVQNFSLSPRKSSRNAFDWGSFSASAFVDAAYLHNRDGAPAQPESIGSIGGTLSWTPSPALRAQIGYGHALNRVAVPGERSDQDHGVHFRITLRPLELF